MSEHGEILITSEGFPRTTTWTLSSRDTTPQHSRDSADGTVGPLTNNPHVPTVRRAVPTGDSASSRDSRDSLQRGVPTDVTSNGHQAPGDGWTDEQLQTLIDQEREA
jgi:hypothetical protein